MIVIYFPFMRKIPRYVEPSKIVLNPSNIIAYSILLLSFAAPLLLAVERFLEITGIFPISVLFEGALLLHHACFVSKPLHRTLPLPAQTHVNKKHATFSTFLLRFSGVCGMKYTIKAAKTLPLHLLLIIDRGVIARL